MLQWFRDYRDCDCFPKFKSYSISEKLPPLLNANPEVVTSIIHFCRKNINTLSVELVHDFLLSQALPQLVNVINQEQDTNNEQYTMENLLSGFRFKKNYV